MKRIAIISEDCYAHIDFDLISFLNKEYAIGWFPFFYFSKSEKSIKEFLDRKEKIDTEYFSYLKLSDRMRSLFTRRDFKKLLLDVKDFSPEVVYLNADGFPWLPILSKRMLKTIPVIGAIHDVSSHSGSSLVTRLYKPLLPKFYKNINTYSDYCYKQLQKKYDKKTVTCCHHPFTDFGKINKIKHKKFTILFFVNILKYKGLPLLLSSVEKAYLKNPNICIKIVRRRNDEYLLEPYKKHPCFNIINRRVEDSEIPKILSDVDVLALPYTDATQSGPMMIALNYGLPIFATDIPAFQEYGSFFSNVFLIKNDVNEWVTVITKFVEKYPEIFIDSEQKYQKEIDSFRFMLQEEWVSLFSDKKDS